MRRQRRPTPQFTSTVGKALERSARRHATRTVLSSIRDGPMRARPGRLPGSPHGCSKHCHRETASAFSAHSDAYVLLLLGCVLAGLVHVSVNCNARNDEPGYPLTQPEPTTVV
jgi:fatty-acyl-CoA synthase